MKVSEAELNDIRNALNQLRRTQLMIDALETAAMNTHIKLRVSGKQWASASIHLVVGSEDIDALLAMLKVREKYIRKELQEMCIDTRIKR